jgi:hypothetical protein
VLTSVIMKDLIVFFLGKRVGCEVKGWILTMEGWVAGDNHEADAEF